jgi:histidyl-tRNA synthetase
MSKPTPLSGFPELLPAQRAVEQHVIDSLRHTFELHGFAGLETRAVEPMDQLLRKGETSKEVYVLRRLQDLDGTGDSGVGLHFDLTVPFARYVLENAGKLEFPFRRYQIQKAWRGERPQEGRFREFTQADIDVVMRDELPFHFDVEVARVMAEALSGLPLPPMRLRVNNRKLIEGFYRGIGAPDPAAVITIIDKLDKMSTDAVASSLVADAGLSDDQAQQCLRLAEIESTDTSFADRVRELGVSHELLEVGIAELTAVVEGCAPAASDRFRVVASLSLARGLDYYTGTVFEIYMDGFENLKSVGGGGRYDALASDGRTTYPGVGISFGISRTLVPLLSRGVLSGDRSVPSAVLVALVDEDDRETSNAVAQRLRARGIPTEVAASAQRFGKQIRYAERRGIPYVWFPARPEAADAEETPEALGAPGAAEAPGAGKADQATGPTGGTGSTGGTGRVRDIRSGNQVDADPDVWEPPAEDLRPRVIPSSAVPSTTTRSANQEHHQ